MFEHLITATISYHSDIESTNAHHVVAYFDIMHTNLSAELCYICLEACDMRWEIENCTERYNPNVRTYCVSVDGGSDTLQRKQCMSVEQAQVFCGKFNRIEGVTCTACDKDLCNAQEILTPLIWLYLIILVVML